MDHRRTNLFLSAWLCLILGGGLASGSLLALGMTIVVGGVVLFFWAMTVAAPQRELSDEEIAGWQPDHGPMPDAGRVMYRIDTTLDEPIRTSIVCGPCGTLTVHEGPKPHSFTCPACGTELWIGEEEE